MCYKYASLREQFASSRRTKAQTIARHLVGRHLSKRATGIAIGALPARQHTPLSQHLCHSRMSAALHSYRAFLRVVAAMPKQQRGAAIQQARSELAFFRDVSDPAEAARLVDAFDGRIAYLRMTTPRRPASQKGRTSIVYRNGEKVDAARERDKAKWSNWDGSNMDPDSVARHNRSLRRAGFRDNAHAKGFF